METKQCATCKVVKPVDDFYAKKNRGYQSYCKPCANARRAQWARDNVAKVRTYRLKYNYNLTDEQYEKLLLAQNGKCAICKQDFEGRPNIDHNHKTGEVRGLLCTGCNVFVGHLETRMLNEATEYIKNNGVFI